MALCEYEKNVLKHINEPRDDDGITSGAALWAAAEFLAAGGYVENGELTEKGVAALEEETI